MSVGGLHPHVDRIHYTFYLPETTVADGNDMDMSQINSDRLTIRWWL